MKDGMRWKYDGNRTINLFRSHFDANFNRLSFNK